MGDYSKLPAIRALVAFGRAETLSRRCLGTAGSEAIASTRSPCRSTTLKFAVDRIEEQQHHDAILGYSTSSSRARPVMASGFKVKAIYEYASEEADDLSFPVGQVITITETIDADWYEGEYTDVSGVKKAGIFPNNFVEKYEPEVPVRPSRPTRPKSVQSPPPAPAPAAKEPEPVEEDDEEDEDDGPPTPAASKPQPPPVQIPAEAPRASEEVRSPPSASSQKAPVARNEPPAPPKPAPTEPAAAESKKPPPPVAPKSNAFKDRIAAFNQPAAAPVMPFQPGGSKGQPSNFIKKPFVAPPPSSAAYVANQKSEPVQKPYRREEDPEIRKRQEEDRAAAEAAGLSPEGREAQAEETEDAPKPQSLKERIAMLQQQQAEQAQRRAGGGEKKEKKTPSRKQTEELEGANEGEDDGAERIRSPGTERQSLDVQRERPRVPSAQRRPTEPVPETTAPPHEILSGGEEADQSAAGETTEDDAETVGPDPSEERPVPAPRAAAAPATQPDVGEEEDTTEEAEDEEDSMDEEERRKFELRQRMAKMSGGMGMAGMFGPPGGMAMPGMGAPKKRTPSAKSTQKKPSEDTSSPMSPPEQPQQAPMVPVPGMQRVQSPPSDLTQREVGKEDEHEETSLRRERAPDVVPDVEDVKPEPPPRASMTEERGAPPPVPKGKVTRKPLPSWRRRSPLQLEVPAHAKSYSICSNGYDGTVCLADTVAIVSALSRSGLNGQTYLQSLHDLFPTRACMLTFLQNVPCHNRSVARQAHLLCQVTARYRACHQGHRLLSPDLCLLHRRLLLHFRLVLVPSLTMRCRCTPNGHRQRHQAWKPHFPSAQRHRPCQVLAKCLLYLLSLLRTSASHTSAVKLASHRRP